MIGRPRAQTEAGTEDLGRVLYRQPARVGWRCWTTMRRFRTLPRRLDCLGSPAQRTRLACGVLQNTGTQHRVNPSSMPNMARSLTCHPSSSGQESPESPAGSPRQGLRPGGLRGSSGCILFPKLQQPAPGLRDPQGGGGDAKTSLALWLFPSCSWWFAQVLWVGDRG
jgi:hypothetical protein